MKQFLLLFTLSISCILSTTAQVTDPVPESIGSSGISLEIENWIQIRASDNSAPFTRINLLRELNDGIGRLFVNDLRGFLWVINGEEADLYLSIPYNFNRFIDAPGKGTGFGAFAFHPEFSSNGKFYTSHSERANSATADFSVPHDDGSGYQMQWVITEWTVEDPQANRFAGEMREVVRFDFPNSLHGVQEIAFNPTATPNDADYGNLYICIGDGGSSILFLEDNLQNRSSHLGTILRIDPLGTDSKNGQYGIPADNPFIEDNDSTVLREIWAYGFRNPHRISWDPEGDHNMFIGEIGEKNIEELNLGIAGGNYGWGVREGTFLYDRPSGREFVYPLPDDDTSHNYVYPVAMYDHDEGNAIIGGYTDRVDGSPLYGQYLCGDIVSGRLFLAPADQLTPGTLTPFQELHLHDSLGNQVTLLGMVGQGRADLRFGTDLSGEIYLLTKGDGWIRRFRTESTTSTQELETTGGFSIQPNPVRDRLNLNLDDNTWIGGKMEIYNAAQSLVISQPISSQNNTCLVADLPAGIYYLRLINNGLSLAQPFIKH